MPLFASFNWIDWLIVAGVLFFILEGWKAGFIQLISGLIAYAGAVYLSIRFHDGLAAFLTTSIGTPLVWSKIIAYIGIALIAQLIIGRILIGLLKRLGRKIIGTGLDNSLGSVVAVFNFLIIMAFVFLVFLALPVASRHKDDIRTSFIAKRLVALAETYGGSVTSSLDQVTRDAIRFVTIKPQSREHIKLDISPQAWELSADESSERIMLEQVNSERIKVGSVPLTPDQELTDVARAYSRDMLLRKYFSHFDPDGNDLKYRLAQAQITYLAAGENLAYAPDVNAAMRGLMESEGHRKNMLDPTFTRTGIGIIDAGVYGRMFTQIFTSQPYYFYNKP
jgi:uncharacterized protein YkwD